jgi:hypothetical protein
MLTHLLLWQRFHAPLIALAMTLGVILAARFLRIGQLGTAAGGLGLVAGWYLLTGRLWPVQAAHSVDQLGAVAVITLFAALVCDWLGSGRSAWISRLVAAVVTAWLLIGAPRHPAALRVEWPIGLAAAGSVLVFARLLADDASDVPRLALAGLTLAAALHIIGVSPAWTQLALVPAVAALAMLTLPSPPGAAALPLATGTAALCCVVAINLGRLARLGFNQADAAALSPLLAVLLQPNAAGRCQGLGRAATLAGCILAGAIAVGCVWLARQALPR